MSGVVCHLLIGDGRDDYHHASRESLHQHLPPTDHVVEIDDRDHRLGFAGAIREGWRQALQTDAEFIWHHELDFTYLQAVPIKAMAKTLQGNPHLTQIALLRQPCNDTERAAGTLADYLRHHLSPATNGSHQWLEHRRFWTTNPSLYPRWVAERGWPDHPESEGHFGIDLFKSDPALRSAFWGNGEEWVRHLGDTRTGWGY
jgi:hypothetical protein